MKAVRISILGWLAAVFIFSITGVQAESVVLENDDDRYSYSQGVLHCNMLMDKFNLSQALPPERADIFRQIFIAGMQEGQTLPLEELVKRSEESSQAIEKRFGSDADIFSMLKNADDELVEKLASDAGIAVVASIRTVGKQVFTSFEFNEKLFFAGWQDGILDKSLLSKSEVEQLNNSLIAMTFEKSKAKKVLEKMDSENSNNKNPQEKMESKNSESKEEPKKMLSTTFGANGSRQK